MSEPISLQNRIDQAILHLDASDAYDLLKRVTKSDSLLEGDLKNMERATLVLRIVAFPELADEEASTVLQKEILQFFRNDIPLEDRISTRYVFQGMALKNIQRKILKEAIMQNTEQLGPLTISEWIKKYDMAFDVEDREADNLLAFLLRDASVENLSESEKFVLKKILHTYDTFLATELIDIFDLATMQKNLTKKRQAYQQKSSSGAIFSPSLQKESSYHPANYKPISQMAKLQINYKKPTGAISKTMQMRIEDAVEKFPELGEQLIGQAPITLRPFPQPVRPSIKNWIATYQQELGVGEHGTMERGTFLYNNQNAKQLVDASRQQLARILKSVDDNSPMTIDAQNQRVVFESQQIPQYKQIETDARNELPVVGRQLEKKIHFSSQHTLPVERIANRQNGVPRAQQNYATPVTTKNEQNNRRNQNDTPRKNVVNLKEP